MKITYNLQEDFLEALGRKMPATCLVRNELNGLRKPREIVKTTPREGGVGVPYMPRRFPVGEWHIINIVPKSGPYMAPYFIATSAWQMVDEWEVKDGAYVKPIGDAADFGYGLHCSTSNTTLGCIRIINRKDLGDLIEAIKECWKKGESVTIQVSNIRPT